MPGTNLTRDEAAARSALLNVDSYLVDLDLTGAVVDGASTFTSTTTIRFSAATPGAETFAEIVAESVGSVVLNGRSLDPAQTYVDSRILLTDLAAENELVVTAECLYSHSGEGLHHFVDPVDGKIYLYTQFEVPDARRVFASFEQPDLKAAFEFTVLAPAHWTVISNTPAAEPVPAGEGVARWTFEPTQRLSTYLGAIVAGEYVGVTETYHGKHGDIPLGAWCRASIRHHLDSDEVFKITRQGFEFFEEAFDFPYPFGKYDQAFVPEYNMGAMENAGLITLRDEYLPSSRETRSFYEFRASVILHEMAHMWFGDLVTMRWWNDLWLNESFAEWACYHAEVEATDFVDSWTGFNNARKQTGYRQDQLVTTHPIAPDIEDLHAIETNFDMITYAKGASVLKQLVAWVGLDPFLTGLRAYFKDYAYGNTVFEDLLAALEKSSGRELTSWAAEWLQTSQVNTFHPEFTLDEDGNYASIAIRQTAPAEHPTLRRHRAGVGLYDKVDGKLVRRRYIELDVEGELTEITDAIGERQPDLLLLNDDDLTYAKIRLDERSLETALSGLSSLDDSLARSLIWSAAWDMTRDAELSTAAFVELVLGNIGTETDSWGISRVPLYAESAVNGYASPETRVAIKTRWETGLRELLDQVEPGSDVQLSLARRYTGAGETVRGGVNGASIAESTLADLQALLSGDLVIDGLVIDQSMRWNLVIGLAASGVFGEEEILAELGRDNTITGKEKSAEARAAMPSAEAKAASWKAAALDPATPNETQRSIAVSFSRATQEDVLAPYLEEFLHACDTLWTHLGSHKASVLLEYGWPRALASTETIARMDEWLATTTAPNAAVRFVREGRDDMARMVACQQV
jgi:aminopeptidase N